MFLPPAANHSTESGPLVQTVLGLNPAAEERIEIRRATVTQPPDRSGFNLDFFCAIVLDGKGALISGFVAVTCASASASGRLVKFERCWKNHLPHEVFTVGNNVQRGSRKLAVGSSER